MSLSLRSERVAIYAYGETMTGGDVATGYTRVPSAASDGAWPAAVGAPDLAETAVASDPEQVADVLIELPAEVLTAAPTFDSRGAVRHVSAPGQPMYTVRTVSPPLQAPGRGPRFVLVSARRASADSLSVTE